jgi:hypothetical protein
MKKNKILIRTFLVAILLVSSFSSCKKDFFDINQDPNNALDANINLLLPSAQAGIGHALGNNLQIFGGLYSQYWTQSPAASQYKTIVQYFPAANDFDNPWAALYSDALQDLKAVIKKADAENKPNYAAIAKILQAYTYQVLTDNWGDVPFSESLQGEDFLISPKYDKQQDIYPGIIQLAKDGIALIDINTDVHPTDDDLIFGGDMYLWYEFGNTLLLKMYLRLSEVDPAAAQAGIAELEASVPDFLYPGETAQISYVNQGGNTNPLYSSYVDIGNTQNLVANATCVNYMNTNLDPRVETLYNPALNGSFVGIPNGDYDLPASTPVAYPGSVSGGYGDDPLAPTAPVIFMSSYESLFLQAEAAARGWLTGDAQALYESAITESFAANGLPDTDASTYYTQTAIAFPAAGSTTDKVKAIVTEKWVSMCGTQCAESWAEQRRTGFPDFFVVSATSILGPGKLPARLLYPDIELTRNGNFPGQTEITDKVWWDVN